MEHLSEAARTVITALQALPEAPELQRANIAIIGGLALQHHAPGYRPTKDVDILIFDRDHPICTLDVRARLASRFPNEFEDVPEPVSSCLNIPDTIKVDFIPQELPPYLPADAATLGELWHAATPEKQKQDAEDAQELVNILSSQGTITLDDSQKQAVLSGLDEMLEYSEEDRDWWESALGLSD
ncbi:hypothetical protein ALT_6026 [Aspergillus lentulus]|uniref:Uncharacterized protein n=1 Tax=Aspergillus lentulus TaxID=293939 RepID=A0AAN4TC05_ASPLE|nr:hypothetical protein ALT_6026 [Aspergillus lentulus]